MVLSVIDPNMKIANVLYEYKGVIGIEQIKKELRKKSSKNMQYFPHPKDLVIISVTPHSNFKIFF